jgi:hypothetical protein
MQPQQRNRYGPVTVNLLVADYLTQSSPSRRVFLAAAALAVTAFLLTISTFTHPPAALFFVFVQVMGIVGSGAGSYYQTATLAVGGAAWSALGRVGV